MGMCVHATTQHLYISYTHEQLVCEPTCANVSTHIWCNLCDMVCHLCPLCPLSFVIPPPLPALAPSPVYPSQCLSATVVYACPLPAPCYTTPIRVACVRILSQAVGPCSSTSVPWAISSSSPPSANTSKLDLESQHKAAKLCSKP